MPVKLKVDDKNVPVMTDNKFTIIREEDQTEENVDIVELYSKLSSVNRESAARRIKIKELEEQLKSMHKEENNTNQDLQTASKTWKQEKEQLEAKLKEYDTQLFKTTLVNQITGSEILKKIVLPPDVAVEYFSKNFEKDETGKLIAKKNGETIFSKKNPGQAADVNEALEFLIDTHPSKDAIYKSSGSGTGMKDNINVNTKSVDVKKMSLVEKSEFIKKYGAEKYKDIVSKQSN